MNYDTFLGMVRFIVGRLVSVFIFDYQAAIMDHNSIYSFHIIRVGLLVMFFAASTLSPTFAQDGKTEEATVVKLPSLDPDSLIRQIQESTDNGDLQRAEALVKSLGQQGDEAAPAIEKAL